MRKIPVTIMTIISKVPFCFKDLNNYEAHWQRHYIRHLIVEDFTDMDRVNSFLDKYYETKIDEDALEIICCTKIRACYILLFLWNKPSFQIQSSVDGMIFNLLIEWFPICRSNDFHRNLLNFSPFGARFILEFFDFHKNQQNFDEAKCLFKDYSCKMFLCF